ncbi:MAG: NUDIX hydrolase [Solobacterium sp.]|nr:NUDIX hydrolase [Solobacterium sp.]
MKLEEKRISSERKYNGLVIKVRVDDAQLADGRMTKREVIEHTGGVVIAMEDEDGSFFFVEQYRYAQQKIMLEFPAGKIEPGSTILENAQREIMEETGYEGEDFTFLGEFVPTGGYGQEVDYLYYAKKGKYVGQHLDADENLNVYKYTLDEIIDKIMDNELTDGKTAVLAFKLRERKQRNETAD